MLIQAFKEKVKKRKLRIGVAGLGYVGLPLAVAFAKAGFHVTGIDVDRGKVERLNAGDSYILDVPSEEVRALVSRRRLHAVHEHKVIAGLDVIVICVPTPLSKKGKPDISFVLKATAEIARHLKKGQLVVLESTSYPGTTEDMMLPLLEKKSGLKVEKDFFLAFSPERVDPGNKNFDTVSIPKVVGGVGRFSTEAAKEVYGSIIRETVPVSSAKTAEMVKLLENTFRSVNIALINEIALLSHRFGIDIWEVIQAAKTKPFGFMPFYPGPGIGGHCLPIDPVYLSWKSREHGFVARMIELASEINESMPEKVVERLIDLLNTRKVALKGAPVLVLGVAYKRDVDDARESPALDVIDELRRRGADVSYADPFVPAIDLNGVRLRSKKLTRELVARQRAAVVLTDHSAFDYAMLVKSSKLVFDTRNVLRKYEKNPNVFFL
ncbi:MAG TPA: nucleotide sugar dehydrogenase [Candidatus Eisenbacteria bacterium]|nr:nucleotide sugar dehydrogenase [Candidatus Eisenbacteria bacterium]